MRFHRSILSLVALSLSLSLGGAELVLRWRHGAVRESIAERANLPRLCAAPDPDLVYAYVPGQCGHNSKGYRDVEHPAEKLPGTRRVVVIGDSVAEGGGVGVFEGFASLLGKNLSRESVPHEIVILARSGYGTEQQIRLLETEAYTYEPDLILWSYVLNDPADPVHHNASGDRGAYYHRPSSYLLHALEGALFALRERWRAMGCPSEYHQLLHCAYREKIEDSFQEIAAIARGHDVPLVVVLHPVFEKDREFESYSLRDVNAQVTRAATRAGLPVIDLLRAYSNHPRDELRQAHRTDWFDPWHPNAKGHRVAATEIARALAVFAGAEAHEPTTTR